jgi:DNA polymerase III delta subunit
MAAAKAKEPDPPAQLRELAAALPPASGAKLARAYLLRGDERYFREKAIELVVTAARAAGLELSRHDARDPDFSQSLLQDDLSAAPMFASARCVLVRNAAALLKKEGGAESPVARALLAYVQGKGPGGGTLVLEAEGLRADHAVAKAVVATGGKSLSLRRLWENPPPWDPDPRKAELVQWLIAQARAQKLELALHDAVYMVAATGNDLFALEAALARVAAAGGKSVRALVEWTSGVSPFQLAEDLARGDGPRALAGCEALFRAGFQDKDGSREIDPAAIQAILLGTLRNKLRQSFACARALEQGSDFAAAAEKAGFQGAPAMRAELESRVRLRDAAGWKKLVLDLAAFERRTRRGTSIDVNDFALLALRWKRVARPAPAARSAGPAARGPRR